MFGIDNNELNRLHNEDFIWFIYFFIVGFNIYSNYLEEKYITNHDAKLKSKYRNINIGIFTIALLIYIYFLKVNYDRINELKYDASKKQQELTYLSFITSIFFLVAGIISLYIAIESKKNDDEIGII